jgi:ATP-binding protein involved in chromosome partitioning
LGHCLEAIVTTTVFICAFVTIDKHSERPAHLGSCDAFRTITAEDAMNATQTKDKIIEELRRVKTPDGNGDIVRQGLVSEIVIQDGKVYFSLAVAPEKAAEFEPLRKTAERAAAMVPGVKAVMVTLTAEKATVKATSGQAASGPAGGPAAQQRPAHGSTLKGIAEVRRIIAVASGKGGVGKSTTAINLALGLKANGLRVGVLDADIYGPSMPRLIGLSGKPEMIDANTLRPMENYGVKVMSIGFLVEEETPMIWRGPMVQSALTQMMRDVAWGPLDILVVDMPPGTGDAQLTMAQQVPLAGAVIVSTPQDLALIDARKGLNMFRRTNVPVLGIVENMSYFLCPHCGGRTDIFSHGGGEQEARRLSVPFLGAVPLDIKVRETSDEGRPIVATAPDSNYAQIYRTIAAKVWEQIGEDSTQRAGPRIVIE